MAHGFRHRRIVHHRHPVFASWCSAKRSVQMGVLALVTTAMLWSGSFVYDQYFQPVPEGVVVSGVELSGLSRAEARVSLEKIAPEFFQNDVKVVLTENGVAPVSKTFSAVESGVTFDVESTLTRIFDRLGMAEADLVFSSETHGAAGEIAPVLSVKEDSFEKLLDWVKSAEREVHDAEISFDETTKQWVFTEHQMGLQLLEGDERLMEDQLLKIAQNDFESSLDVVLERIEPAVTSEELRPLYESIQKLLGRKAEWNIGKETVSFSLAEHPEAIVVDSEKKEVTLSKEILEPLLKKLVVPFEHEAGSVAVSEPVKQEKGYLKSAYEGEFVSGRKADIEKMLEQLLEEKREAEEVQELPFLQVAPIVEMEGVGELTLLSQGRSSYVLAHSEERAYNVKFGLAKYDGVVVPRGEVFNFNQVLGWVTLEAGWKPALAIFGGGGVRPVPGGGLCQVATTMYRAAINSGLLITQRKPHSLDVSYYQAYGYGIDATVYPPDDVNLKFKNDTQGDILMHTYLDEDAKEAFIEFYGIDDGRRVELRELENRPVKLPQMIVSSPELGMGTREVVTGGRIGRYIEWEWLIKKADGTEEKRLIETLYPAAPAVVKVGG